MLGEDNGQFRSGRDKKSDKICRMLGRKKWWWTFLNHDTKIHRNLKNHKLIKVLPDHWIFIVENREKQGIIGSGYQC